jgi:putative hydrolase of the HAD superfamily
MEINILGMTFDLEGTLVDLELAHHLGHLLTARELGLTLTLDEARKRFPSFFGGPDRSVAAELQRAFETTMNVDDIVSRTRSHFERLKSSFPIKPRSGALRFLAEAKARGYLMAIGSATSRKEGNILLEVAGLGEYFVDRCRVFLEDVVEPKPAAAIFNETAKRLGINPSEQLVFEDSPNGVIAASSAGSFVIAVPAVSNRMIKDRLEAAGALYIFDGWAAISIKGVMHILAERQYVVQ